jgi:hypothetical protein
MAKPVFGVAFGKHPLLISIAGMFAGACVQGLVASRR